MSPEERIAKMGLALPAAPGPIGAYVPVVRTENLLFVSGQLPLVDGELHVTGHVGGEVSPEQAADAMRRAVLNALSIIRAELGSLDQVRRVVRLVGHVSSAPDFFGQTDVTNAASELLQEVFGPARGSHARLALGAAALPKNSPIELELIIEAEE